MFIVEQTEANEIEMANKTTVIAPRRNPFRRQILVGQIRTKQPGHCNGLLDLSPWATDQAGKTLYLTMETFFLLL